MSAISTHNLEDMRQYVLGKFASLLESQTRTNQFGANISEMIRSIHGEAAGQVEEVSRLMDELQIDAPSRQRIASNLDQLVVLFRQMDESMGLLLEERARQWQKNGHNLGKIMMEFNQVAKELDSTLIEKDLLERQSAVLEKIILSHEKVTQWKDFVQEILAGLQSIFPFNVFFVAFAEEHGMNVYIYHVARKLDKERSESIRKKLIPLLITQLGLPDDVLLDVEEFLIEKASSKIGPGEDVNIITVPVLNLEKVDLAGLLGVAYGSSRILTSQEESVIRSILAVMVMVVGSSKALSQTLAELEYYSTHDPLTGLHNRRYFNEMVEYEIGRSERHGHVFTILMLDLDDFKDVNDGYGHPCGDLVLKQVADVLHKNMRKGDLATRIGGDEFAILLTETTKSNALVVADKIRVQLRETSFISPEGKLFHITTSIGLIGFPEDGSTLTDLMAGVDIGLYKAKAMGKDSISSIEAAQESILLNRSTRDNAEKLRSALKNDSIIPYFQPIFNCATGEIFAFETLARLVEPDGETLSAGMFIETIEKYGLGRELDRAIIQKALWAIKNHASNDPGSSRIFINLSAQEIQGRGVLGFAEQLCQEMHISPECVVFEILERDAIGDMTNMRKFLAHLRGNGFSFALDDFGSGYNSFHYLRELHFDYVKIDGAFVRNILNSKIDYALVRNLSKLCQDIGTRTVAEFVESKEILEALQSMGIDYVQGFHLGVPRASMAS